PATEKLAVDGPFDEVREVLTILLLHSIEALSSGGRLGVTVRKDGRFAVVSLAADSLKESASWDARMFEPNWSEPNSLIGIGPYIARQAAADFGGEISSESRSARNAVLHVRLPLAN